MWRQKTEVNSLNGLEILALTVVGVWLGALTLVVILSVRQISLLTVRLSTTTNHASPEIVEPDFSVDNDGPEVGSEIPEEVTSVLPELLQGNRWHILLVSANCSPCRKLATKLSGRPFASPVIALVAGREKALADGLEELLPPEMHTVRDPKATELARALQIHSTPFVVAAQNGRVVKKAYIYQPSDFVKFVQDESTSIVVEITPKPKEVDRVG